MFEKEQKIFQNLTIFSKSQNKEEKEEEIIDFSFRIKAIQKIDTICSKLNFQNETFFFAVYYLDKMISSLPLTLKNQSDFAIIACVSIAGKVYEEEVPSISCFQMFFPKYHKKSKSYNQISNLEVELIKIIDSFIPTTVNSFLEYFLSRVSNFLQVNKEKKEIFIFQNEKNQFIVQDDDIYTKMIKLIKIVIKNPISVNFFPSEIAASILSIYFPDDDLIIFVTGYSIKQLEECRNLFNLYNNNLDFKF
ncbi:cyclin [Anaeramoeba ignava]|uniref:Cyclin n=1 Tax=Anaeramoeba ignava TaxID=1746090 RepID=A0A9Q0LQ33_ANAIG|nr:cyclin [Anaeramoeba ignava]